MCSISSTRGVTFFFPTSPSLVCLSVLTLLYPQRSNKPKKNGSRKRIKNIFVKIRHSITTTNLAGYYSYHSCTFFFFFSSARKSKGRREEQPLSLVKTVRVYNQELQTNRVSTPPHACILYDEKVKPNSFPKEKGQG